MTQDGHISFSSSTPPTTLTPMVPSQITHPHVPPEVLKNRPFSSRSDFWILGSILYEMVTGVPPFYNERALVMANLIRQATHCPRPSNPPISDNAYDLLSKLIVPNPQERLCIFRLLMDHPFFASINWDLLRCKLITPPQLPSFEMKKSSSFDCDNEFLIPGACYDGFNYTSPPPTQP